MRTVRPLSPETWPAFADLVERDGGVWGGCWCMGFHAQGFRGTAEAHREDKEALVRSGEARAALVLEDGTCVGWCQFGTPAELPRIKLRRAYEAEPPAVTPEWRVTCFYVGKGHRRQGVSAAALAGALEQVAALGGGRVESFPEDVTDRKVSSSFLHNGTLAMFEAQGFERVRRLGKSRWLVVRHVAPSG